jgi:hypothetical protein
MKPYQALNNAIRRMINNDVALRPITIPSSPIHFFLNI